MTNTSTDSIVASDTASTPTSNNTASGTASTPTNTHAIGKTNLNSNAFSVTENDNAIGTTATDRDFLRLQELVDMLPAMSVKNEYLQRATSARHLLELCEKAQILQAEHDNYLAIIDAAINAARQAEASKDTQERSKQLGIARTYSDIDATRLAPLERAKIEYQNAVRDSLIANELTSNSDFKTDANLDCGGLPSSQPSSQTSCQSRIHHDSQANEQSCNHPNGLPSSQSNNKSENQAYAQSDYEQLKDLSLSDREYEKLLSEINSFREEYDFLYAACCHDGINNDDANDDSTK